MFERDEWWLCFSIYIYYCEVKMGVELVGSVLGGNGGLDVPNFFFLFS